MRLLKANLVSNNIKCNEMKNIFLFILFIFSVGTTCYSQSRKIIEGIYKGGICADGAICGTWLLKPDSTFVFLDFQGDYLKHIGLGKWLMVSDTMINFYFEENQIPILEKSQVNYSSETIQSYDSTYIIGQLKNQQNNGIPYASIVINEKHATVSDSSGNFKLIFSRLSVIPDNLIVIKKINGYNVIKIPLNKNNNYHKVDVIMPLIDSTTSLPAYNSNALLGRLLSGDKPLEMRINRFSPQRKGYVSISLIDRNTNRIIEKLNKAKQNQPYLSANIKLLIAIINK